MKAFTIGWMIVFLILFLINMYILKSYINIPFKEFIAIKRSIYGGIHLVLTLLTIYYFYIYFSAKTDKKYVEKLSNIAGFHMTFINYSMFLYLIYDLIFFTRNRFPYSEQMKLYGSKIFFGGFVIFGIAGCIALFSLYLAKDVRIKEYSIILDKKESTLNSLNIIYISDGHLNRFMVLNEIDELVDSINKLKPDILFLGGDFFDEGTMTFDKQKFSKEIIKVETKYGIYSVEGNHEYKSGNQNINHQMKYLLDNGIVVLQDEFVELDGMFYVIGRKDKKGDRKNLNEIMYMDKDLPKILLDHRPSFKESKDILDIDLQISGHTHNGQYFPLNLFDFIVSKINSEYFYGYHKINKLNHIVSSGIGNWGLPIRFGSTREIVNIKVTFE